MSLQDPPKRNGGIEALQDDEVIRTIVKDEVRRNAKYLKSAFLGQMEVKLSEMVDSILEKAELQIQPNSASIFLASSAEQDKRKTGRTSGKLPEKVFELRPSPLTELLEITHFKTIHHIFVASLVLFAMNIIITEIAETGTVDFGIEGFQFGFGKPEFMFGILAGMHLVTMLVVHPAFSFWANYRQRLDFVYAYIFDNVALVGFLTFLIGFIYIPAHIMWRNPLAPASGVAVTMEQCRLLMKIYAFVRSNVPRARSFKKYKKVTFEEDEIDAGGDGEGRYSPAATESRDVAKSSLRNRNPKLNMQGGVPASGSWTSKMDEASPCPNYSKYLYFLFAPTLIYKDSYPRTTHVRWNYVAWNFAQVLGCSWYINFIIRHCCISYFAQFGLQPMNLSQLLQNMFALMLPGIMCLILGFFLILHAWQNAFAEMLCFGDRQFYKDWWNCSTFASYYKTWNIIVHDWLYTYVFKDAWEFGLGRINSVIPTTLVFLMSSLFHEYILSFTFNFFFPVLLTLFGGFGFALVFIRSGQKSAVGNVLMWMSLISGTGIIIALYGFEYFARRNCPLPEEVSAWDFFQPRALSFSCGAFVLSFT